MTKLHINEAGVHKINYFYTSDICPNAEKGAADGVNILLIDVKQKDEGKVKGGPCLAKCGKSHNLSEQLYHPERYKRKFCTFYPNNIQNCEYGDYCSFAHNEYDIAVDLLHNYEYDEDFYMFFYKTIWCPFNLNQHDKSLCVYSHNWQDYRRKPQEFLYDAQSCTNWNSNEFILEYEDGCKDGMACGYSHGWKESEYHPLNYKNRPCANIKNCNRGRDCPYYHGQKDKRFANNFIYN